MTDVVAGWMLTRSEVEVLAALPVAPSRGMRCRGWRRTAADSLVARGLAACAWTCPANGARYYMRVPQGA